MRRQSSVWPDWLTELVQLHQLLRCVPAAVAQPNHLTYSRNADVSFPSSALMIAWMLVVSSSSPLAVGEGTGEYGAVAGVATSAVGVADTVVGFVPESSSPEQATMASASAARVKVVKNRSGMVVAFP